MFELTDREHYQTDLLSEKQICIYRKFLFGLQRLFRIKQQTKTPTEKSRDKTSKEKKC